MQKLSSRKNCQLKSMEIILSYRNKKEWQSNFYGPMCMTPISHIPYYQPYRVPSLSRIALGKQQLHKVSYYSYLLFAFHALNPFLIRGILSTMYFFIPQINFHYKSLRNRIFNWKLTSMQEQIFLSLPSHTNVHLPSYINTTAVI